MNNYIEKPISSRARLERGPVGEDTSKHEDGSEVMHHDGLLNEGLKSNAQSARAHIAISIASYQERTNFQGIYGKRTRPS